ncbi:hypothetical protein FB451DRAFT_1369214 [Mycena latifolia]|nr:hypothetical protein FB451DRAFT_1369214 [Mycena latifolia]
MDTPTEVMETRAASRRHGGKHRQTRSTALPLTLNGQLGSVDSLALGDYRILVLRAMGDQQELPLLRHAEQDAAADHFLRRHCRYSLSLRGGDIRDVYSNGAILNMMHELGVDYIGSGDREPTERPSSERVFWRTFWQDDSTTPDDLLLAATRNRSRDLPLVPTKNGVKRLPL